MRDPLLSRRLVQELPELSAGEVADFYTRCLAEDRATAILIRPSQQGLPVDAATGVGSDRYAHWGVEEALPPPADVRRWMSSPGAGVTQRMRLRNGLEVWMLPLPGARFHTALLGFRGGLNFGTTPGAAIASMFGTWRRGLPPSVRGVLYFERIDQDSLGEFFRSTGSNVGLTLEFVGKELGEYDIRWPYLQSASRLELYRREDDAPATRLARRRWRALLGSHPYAAQASLAEVQRVSARGAHDWAVEVRRPNNSLLVLVGDFDPGAARAIIERETGDWGEVGQRYPKTPAPPPARPTVLRERVLIDERPGATQATLGFGCLLPPATAENAAAEELFAELVGNYFWALREQFGASYSPSTQLVRLAGGTAAMTLDADIDYRRLDPALKWIRSYLEDASRGQFQQRKLDVERARMARRFNLRYATTADLAQAMFDTWNMDWPLEELDRYPDRLMAVTPVDVAAIAEYCRTSAVITLLGNAGRLRAGWESARSP
jgi:zinc protease